MSALPNGADSSSVTSVVPPFTSSASSSAPASSTRAAASSDSSLPLLAEPPAEAAQHASTQRLPTLHDICAAQWPTLLYVPADVRDDWSAIFTEAIQAFVSAPLVETLTSLFLCCKALLASVRHGGKARMEAVNRTLRARFTLWRAGRYMDLWERVTSDHAKRTAAEQKHEDDQLLREARRVANLVDQGMLSRAASQLCSRGVAPDSPELLQKIGALFPEGTLPLHTTGMEAPAFEFQPELVKKLVLSSPKGLAAGCSGLRAEHVKAVLQDRNAGRAAQALEALTKFANLCVAGYLPGELQAYFCSGRLIPLNKKDGGIRPIVVGEFLRGMVSKLALKEVDHTLQALQPAQIGVGGKGPVIQAAILCVKSWLSDLSEDELLLKVDISNAYNTISRAACMEGVKKYCPDLARWTRWCLNGSSRVYHNTHVIPCTTGVQQGDPLAPVLFSVGLHMVVEQLLAIPEIRQLWFLDDGLLRGKGPEVRRALAIMTSELAKIDLSINLRKCEIYIPSHGSTPAGFDDIPVVHDRDAWSYLGTPLCEQTRNALVSVQARVSQATSKIAAFAKSHPKQAFLLLRATAGACKVEYLLQTLSRTQLSDDLVSTCSTDMRQAYAAICRATSVTDFEWAHATLPQREGGFGLRDPKTIVDTARVASLVNVTKRLALAR